MFDVIYRGVCLVIGICFLVSLTLHVFFGFEPSTHAVASAALIGASVAFFSMASRP